MAVGIIRTAWSGTSGGPGLTQIAIAETVSGGTGSFFTATNVQNAVNAMRTFWDSIKGILPNELLLTVQPTVDIYNEVNGDLIASITAATAPLNVAGTDAGSYAMASGLKATLQTGVIANGRRVRGAIFIVPAGASALTAFGTAASAARTTVNNAGAAFRTALAVDSLIQVVYSRPVTAAPDATPPVVARDGFLSAVSAYDTNEKTAVLRGRRD